jgi:hypothetical protein
MPGEVIPEIVKVATTMVPALRTVPILRGLIVPLSNVGNMNETKALEELQRAADKHKQQREQARSRVKSRVIKVSDAMKCVDEFFSTGRLALSIGKAILSTITSSFAGDPRDATDIAHAEILECMKRKMLQQRNRRSKGRYVKIRGPQIGTKEKYNLPESSFSELVRVRRGRLHPLIPH